MSRPSPVGYCQCTAPMNRVTGFILVYICINSGRRDANLHAFPPSLPLQKLVALLVCDDGTCQPSQVPQPPSVSYIFKSLAPEGGFHF